MWKHQICILDFLSRLMWILLSQANITDCLGKAPQYFSHGNNEVFKCILFTLFVGVLGHLMTMSTKDTVHLNTNTKKPPSELAKAYLIIFKEWLEGVLATLPIAHKSSCRCGVQWVNYKHLLHINASYASELQLILVSKEIWEHGKQNPNF